MSVTLPDVGGIVLQVTNVKVKLELPDTLMSEIVPFEMQRRQGDFDRAE